MEAIGEHEFVHGQCARCHVMQGEVVTGRVTGPCILRQIGVPDDPIIVDMTPATSPDLPPIGVYAIPGTEIRYAPFGQGEIEAPPKPAGIPLHGSFKYTGPLTKVGGPVERGPSALRSADDLIRENVKLFRDEVARVINSLTAPGDPLLPNYCGQCGQRLTKYDSTGDALETAVADLRVGGGVWRHSCNGTSTYHRVDGHMEIMFDRERAVAIDRTRKIVNRGHVFQAGRCVQCLQTAEYLEGTLEDCTKRPHDWDGRTLRCKACGVAENDHFHDKTPRGCPGNPKPM